MLFKYAEKYVAQQSAKKRAARLRAKEGAGLRAHFPMLPKGRADAQLQAIQSEYAPYHAKYVVEVSAAHAAVSLEQAALLAYLVRTSPVTGVMDTGSGFSTFVLRRESQKKGGVRHVAVEDNDFWLDKTRGYLASHQLPTGDVVAWSQFQAQGGDGQFDLVFHDMGDTTTRILALPLMKQSTSDKGLLILDDMHKSHYYPHALSILGEDWVAESMVELTHDALGRFAHVSRRRPAAGKSK